MAKTDQELRQQLVADMLESEGWAVACQQLERDLQQKKDALCLGRHYDLEAIRMLQGEIKLLDALLNDTQEFFCPT